MRIKFLLVILLFILCGEALAAGQHVSGSYHALTLYTDVGQGRDDTIERWDITARAGSDDNKLWLKSEGERTGPDTTKSELWALYSRNVDTFWDAQIGMRYDWRPVPTSYLVFGFAGLAPAFFETEVHVFASDDGDVSLRAREENDFQVTQKLVLKPYVEANLYAQDVKEQNIGSGLTKGELGLQVRYELTRKLAPYLDFRYEKLFGDTASMSVRQGERNSDFVVAAGIQLIF